MQKMMIELLRGLLFARDAGGVELDGTELSEAELAELYKLSKHHDVAHLVGAALDGRGLLPEGAEISERFRKEQFIALYRAENLEYESAAIAGALDGAGIGYVPLKGAVIRAFYPEAWMRTSCDVDVLVREEELARACEVLVDRLSYTTDGKKDYHDISLYSPSGVHLELHYSIKETIPCMDAVLERVWEYAVKVGESRYELTAEFLMFHLIAHAAYHFAGGGCGVRALIDLKLLRDRLEYDRDRLGELLASGGLDVFAENIFALCDVWFGEREHSELTREIEDFILSGGVYGSMENNLAIKRGRAGSRGKYIRSRLFVPYESLKIHYPGLEGHRALTPVYQVRRWGRLLSAGNRRRVARELRVNASTTSDDSRRAMSLMERVGISFEK